MATERWWKPLQHVLENVLVAAELHTKVDQVKACRATQAINQSFFNCLIYFVNTVLRLKKAEDSKRNRVIVELALWTNVSDSTFCLLHLLPLLQAVTPIVLRILLRFRVWCLDKDMQFFLLLRFILFNHRHLFIQTFLVALTRGDLEFDERLCFFDNLSIIFLQCIIELLVYLCLYFTRLLFTELARERSLKRMGWIPSLTVRQLYLLLDTLACHLFNLLRPLSHLVCILPTLQEIL